MSATALNIAKVNALPLTYQPNTLYMVATADAEIMELYLSNVAGTSLRHVSTAEDTLNQVIAMSDTAPNPATTNSKFWWNSGTASLYVLYDDGTNKNWVEAVPALSIPEFAGTGVELTMAHSDHYHTDLTLAVAQW